MKAQDSNRDLSESGKTQQVPLQNGRSRCVLFAAKCIKILPISNGSIAPVAVRDGTKLATTMKEQVCLNAVTVESPSYSKGVLSTRDTCNLTEAQCSI